MKSRNIVLFIFPSVVFGIFFGLTTYTFYYAQGLSYLSNNPAACANCHIMNDQYNAWMKSSHHHVAVCNDCHAPHFAAAKYLSKAINGFNHSFAFTTGAFHEPIQITSMNREIVEASCRHCHQNIVHAIEPIKVSQGVLSCVRCHQEVGH